MAIHTQSSPLSWDQKFFTICWHIFVGVTNNNTHKIHNTNTHCNAELSHRHTNLKTITLHTQNRVQCVLDCVHVQL